MIMEAIKYQVRGMLKGNGKLYSVCESAQHPDTAMDIAEQMKNSGLFQIVSIYEERSTSERISFWSK